MRLKENVFNSNGSSRTVVSKPAFDGAVSVNDEVDLFGGEAVKDSIHNKRGYFFEELCGANSGEMA
jgi:hypothetical protein